MSIVSRIIGKVFKLPPAVTYDIIVERGLEVPMPDGVVLLADHYYPRGSTKPPTILMRCPYGRGSLYGLGGLMLAMAALLSVVYGTKRKVTKPHGQAS